MFGLEIRVFDKTTREIDVPASGGSLSLQDEQSFDQKWYNLRQGMQIYAMLLTCGPACVVARTDWCVTSGVLYILAHCFIMWKATESK
jgi:hypothetical protein